MVIKVFILDLYEGFILKVFAEALKETRKRGFQEEFGAGFSDERAESGYNFILNGPNEKLFAKIVREKIREVKKAGIPKREGRT